MGGARVGRPEVVRGGRRGGVVVVIGPRRLQGYADAPIWKTLGVVVRGSLRTMWHCRAGLGQRVAVVRVVGEQRGVVEVTGGRISLAEGFGRGCGVLCLVQARVLCLGGCIGISSTFELSSRSLGGSISLML